MQIHLCLSAKHREPSRHANRQVRYRYTDKNWYTWNHVFFSPLSITICVQSQQQLFAAFCHTSLLLPGASAHPYPRRRRFSRPPPQPQPPPPLWPSLLPLLPPLPRPQFLLLLLIVVSPCRVATAAATLYAALTTAASVYGTTTAAPRSTVIIIFSIVTVAVVNTMIIIVVTVIIVNDDVMPGPSRSLCCM